MRVLIIPGGSAWLELPEGLVARIVADEVVRRGGQAKVALLPGHAGIDGRPWSLECDKVQYSSSDPVNYSTSVAVVSHLCQTFRPTWIFARSFSCFVAAGVISSSATEDWYPELDGACLWGPWLHSKIARSWDTPERVKELIDRLAQRGTVMDDSFFRSLPYLELLIESTGCDLRFARGSRDENNFLEELDYLAALHRRAQPVHAREVVEIAGLPSNIKSLDSLSDSLKSEFLKCALDPLPNPGGH